jgi:hypothetical protein
MGNHRNCPGSGTLPEPLMDMRVLDAKLSRRYNLATIKETIIIEHFPVLSGKNYFKWYL